jgi:hypothetical protein
MILFGLFVTLFLVSSILCAENVKDLNQLSSLLDNNIKLLSDMVNTPKDRENAEVTFILI